MPKVPDVITAANWREHVELECSEGALNLLQSRDKPVMLVTEVPRCQCRQCGHVFEIAPLLPQPMSTTPKG